MKKLLIPVLIIFCYYCKGQSFQEMYLDSTKVSGTIECPTLESYMEDSAHNLMGKPLYILGDFKGDAPLGLITTEHYSLSDGKGECAYSLDGKHWEILDTDRVLKILIQLQLQTTQPIYIHRKIKKWKR